MSKIPLYSARSRSLSSSRRRSVSDSRKILEILRETPEIEEVVVGLTVEEDAVLDLKTIPTIDENDVKVKCSPVGEQESPAMGPIEDEEFELDVNNNRIFKISSTPPPAVPTPQSTPNHSTRTTTLSLLPHYKIFQLPFSPPITVTTSSTKLPTVTLIKRGRRSGRTISTHLDVTKTELPGETDNAHQEIMLARTTSTVVQEELFRKISSSMTDESRMSSLLNYVNFDTNYESEILTNIFNFFPSGLLQRMGNFLSEESIPTDTINYNGYKITVSGRGMLLKSVNVNCHMVEGMSENDDLHRVRVEVLVRSFGGELNALKTTASNTFRLNLHVRDELEQEMPKSVIVQVPEGVRSASVNWGWATNEGIEVEEKVLVVKCP